MTVEIFGIERAGHIINAARKRAMAGSIEVGWDSRERYTDGTSVAMVALIQEFGTVRVTKAGRQWIPPRPFMRRCVERNKTKWARAFTRSIEEGNTQMDAAKSVKALMVSDLRAAIIAFSDPPNAPSTIRKRVGISPWLIKGQCWDRYPAPSQPRQSMPAHLIHNQRPL